MGDTETNSRGCCYDMIVVVCFFISVAGIIGLMIYVAVSLESPVPNIEIASMDFTVRNITQTRLTANWDLLIRVPDHFICLQGDIQASLFYKNITLVTSSEQRYNDLKSGSPQQLRVSAAISEEDIGGLIGENIIKDIKDERKVKFGSKLFFTDCRKGKRGVISYVCNETTLRFEPGSETKATKFGNNPTCTNF
ncbi:PREDICTED: uncharacterized protein LOC104789755 [Camelina sativa]|uniref:Uncharacterized protein LOC104789755 n=1 Tax=Camelina sativa TaxID=90675 RepID=A0ABM0ZCA5_CAMSA|nr:PREDICTED: uncharacterized protein LOC104789755 [Camelina sativa]